MSDSSFAKLFKNWRLPWCTHYPTIGIEIGSSSVRAVVLERFQDQWHLKACGVQDFDGDAEDVTVQQLALTRLLMRLGMSQGSVSVTTHTPVMSRTIALPSGLSDDDIDLLIRLDADKYIPHPLDEVSFDFWVLGDDGREMSVLLVAVRMSMVDRCAEIVAAVGLDVNVVDVHEYALARGLTPVIVDLSGEVAIIHIDDSKTYVYAAHMNQHRIFSGFHYRQEYLNHALGSADDIRAIKVESDASKITPINDNDSVEGMDFYEFLAQHRQDAIKNADAPTEKLSESLDFDHSSNIHSYSSDYEIRFDAVVDAGADLTESLGKAPACHDVSEQVANLQKMLLSYESSAHTKVDVVVLSGLSDEYLAAQLSQVVGVPVYLADPFLGMSISRGVSQAELDGSSRLVVACGLAMRGFDGVSDE
ncbi:type IV pilus biogenesis protein PilM [Moraxella bovoculi]|uniref:type IV pilus biogenesis protein PilM n=1 Tax=Moraxella bovoculi TaxID=386891 RepID=UPI003F4FB2B5